MEPRRKRKAHIRPKQSKVLTAGVSRVLTAPQARLVHNVRDLDFEPVIFLALFVRGREGGVLMRKNGPGNDSIVF